MRRIQLRASGGGACETEQWLVRLALRPGRETAFEIAIGKETAAAMDWSGAALFATAANRSALD